MPRGLLHQTLRSSAYSSALLIEGGAGMSWYRRVRERSRRWRWGSSQGRATWSLVDPGSTAISAIEILEPRSLASGGSGAAIIEPPDSASTVVAVAEPEAPNDQRPAVSAEGDLTQDHAVTTFLQAARSRVAKSSHLLLDLSGVEVADSRLVASLVAIELSARRDNCALDVRTSPVVDAWLRVCRLDQLLHLESCDEPGVIDPAGRSSTQRG